MKYREIVGRFDIEYECNICGLKEYDAGEDQEIGFNQMYRDDNSIDICSYCMETRRLKGEKQEIVDDIILVQEYDIKNNCIVGDGYYFCSSDCWAKMCKHFLSTNPENMIFGRKAKLTIVPNMTKCSFCEKDIR